MEVRVYKPSTGERTKVGVEKVRFVDCADVAVYLVNGHVEVVLLSDEDYSLSNEGIYRLQLVITQKEVSGVH